MEGCEDLSRYRREQAGAYLRRVRDAKRHIASLNSEIEEQRALASGLTGIDYSRVMVQTSPTADAMPDAVARLLDIIEQRVGLVRDYVRMLDGCGQALAAMNGTYGDVLRYRYLCDFSWEQISSRLNYSEQWLYELHGQALDAFYDYMPPTEKDAVPSAI